MKPRTLLLLMLFSNSLCLGEDVMVLNVSRIGKSIQSIEPLLAMRSTNAAAPKQVTLELEGDTIIGGLIEYPKAVTKQMVRDSLNSTFARSEKKFSSDAVFAWRDQEKKISMLVGDEKGVVVLIVRSIDKKVLKGSAELQLPSQTRQ